MTYECTYVRDSALSVWVSKSLGVWVGQAAKLPLQGPERFSIRYEDLLSPANVARGLNVDTVPVYEVFGIVP